MTQEIVNQGIRVVAAGANPVSLRNGVVLAASMLAAKVKAIAKPVSSNAGRYRVSIVYVLPIYACLVYNIVLSLRV
jgi:chaperonin GroEL (HSP60 family)